MRQVLVPRDLAPVMPLRAPGASIVSLGGETMGTTWSVKLVQPASVSTAALCGGLERALASIVCEMSTWIGDSNISRFNDAAPGAWHGAGRPDGRPAPRACGRRNVRRCLRPNRRSPGRTLGLWAARAPACPRGGCHRGSPAGCGWHSGSTATAFISPAVCASTFPRSRRVLRSTRRPLISIRSASPIIWSRSGANSAAPVRNRMVAHGGSL